MGNSDSALTLSQLRSNAAKVNVSPPDVILERLGIEIQVPLENDDAQKEEKKSIDQVPDNDKLHTFLDEYLNGLAEKDFIALFSRFGVIPDLKHKNDNISGLKLIASIDFWRKNYQFHANSKRVKNWMFVHEKYRGFIDEISKTANESKNLENAQNLLTKFNKKLEGHTDFEENMLLKFFEENLSDAIAKETLQELTMDHKDEVPKMTTKLSETKELSEFQTLFKQYQTKLLAHLELEERSIVHVWLNLNEEQYKKYRTYLSWKYGAVY